MSKREEVFGYLASYGNSDDLTLSLADLVDDLTAENERLQAKLDEWNQDGITLEDAKSLQKRLDFYAKERDKTLDANRTLATTLATQNREIAELRLLIDRMTSLHVSEFPVQIRTEPPTEFHGFSDED